MKSSSHNQPASYAEIRKILLDKWGKIFSYSATAVGTIQVTTLPNSAQPLFKSNQTFMYRRSKYGEFYRVKMKTESFGNFSDDLPKLMSSEQTFDGIRVFIKSFYGQT